MEIRFIVVFETLHVMIHDFRKESLKIFGSESVRNEFHSESDKLTEIWESIFLVGKAILEPILIKTEFSNHEKIRFKVPKERE